MNTDTKSIVIELDTDTDHRALVLISQVMGETQKVAALDIFQRGLTALAADPAWQAQSEAHEAQRTSTLTRLGLTVPLATAESYGDTPAEPPVDTAGLQVDQLPAAPQD
jgi:hypothetical protein